jgi:2-deoxy-D-gluconate 3-dehydrogenase
VSNAFDLTGRVALVTGGNGGIGLGIARGLAKAGAAVAIAGRNTEKNASALTELKAFGAEVQSLQVDVADEAACRAMPGEVHERLGRLDILVNNAGVARRTRPETMSLEIWNTIIAINLTGVLVASQAAHPLMKAAGGGKIINIGSMYSIFGAPYVSAYAVTKGGVVQLTKSLAAAWAADNIQVNAILPGWIDTDMTRAARTGSAEFSDGVVARTPAGRWGEIDDFQGPAVFLASAASDFVTGAVLAVDGGYSITG